MAKEKKESKFADNSVLSSYVKKEAKARETERLVRKGVLVETNVPGEYGYRPKELRREAIKSKIVSKAKGIGKKYADNMIKAISSRAVYKSAIKKGPQATIVENQPVYSKDRSRFFKDTWEEEKRSLFFR